MDRRGSIGFLEAYSIGVGGMIGGGIFAVLGLSLSLAGAAAPLAFLLAGLVAALTGYSYARLSLRYPSRGGTVEYLVRAYGTGIVSGWLNMLLLASYVVMIALYAYAFGSYASEAIHAPWLSRSLAVAVIAVFTLINALGAAVSGRVEDALVFFKLGVLLLVGSAGLAAVDWARLGPENWPPPLSIAAGGMVIFLAYEGFELVSNAAADAENPRVIPRAIYASIATVIAVYVAVAVVAAGTLTPEQVERYRDYALAVAARPALGTAGMYLVTAAALASTASAINATLYGTAGISYVVARYGQLPRRLARTIWGHAPEGLPVVAGLSALLAARGGLEAIAAAGSGGFLIVFTAVNIAAYRLRREARVNPALALLAAASTLSALAVLVARMLETSPGSLTVLAAAALLSLAAEAAIRAATGRRLSAYIDHELRTREELVRRWAEWVPRLAREALRLGIREVYLVGSVARGELEKASDVDILLIAEKRLGRREKEKLTRELRRRAGLTRLHPVDIHVAEQREREKWLAKSRRAVKLAEAGNKGKEGGQG